MGVSMLGAMSGTNGPRNLNETAGIAAAPDGAPQVTWTSPPKSVRITLSVLLP